MFLVSGAAGKTGLAILRRLRQLGHPVRAFIRRTDQADKVHRAGADESVVGDMADKGDWDQAGSGVNGIYHIGPNLHPSEAEIGALAIHAAQSHHVERFVYHSVLHPHVQAMPHHWKKLEVEEQLFASGLRWTILQPASYMQNVLPKLPEILDRGIYSVPYPVSTRLGMVDLEDVAQVAAQMLTEGGHTGATYELGGTEILSQRDVAAVFSKHLGHPVNAEEENLEQWKKRMAGLSEYALETLIKMFAYYADHGFWGNPTVHAVLLGRAPTTFSEFVKRILSGKTTEEVRSSHSQNRSTE